LTASVSPDHDRPLAHGFEDALVKDLQEDSRVEIQIQDGSNVFCPSSYKEKRNWNVFVAVSCGSRKVSTREVDCTRNPAWHQTLQLDILPGNAETSLKFSLMLKEKDFLSEIGMFQLRVDEESGRRAFPDIDDKSEEIYFTLTEFFRITSLEGQFEFKMKDDSRSQKGFKTCISVKIRHFEEKRPSSYNPSEHLLEVMQEQMPDRGLTDIDLVTEEILQNFPSSSLMSRKFLQFLCMHGRLQRWSESDVVGVQNEPADKNCGHLILSGVFTLHHQNKKPDLALYDTLKSRSFGPNVSFGNQIGIRGPGEWLGEVDLLASHKKHSTMICRTQTGLTLTIDRRSLEMIIEQWHGSAAGYSFSLHGSILRGPTEGRQTSTLMVFFKNFACHLFKQSDDEFLELIAECASLHTVEAGEQVLHASDKVSIICSGMIACIERSEQVCLKCDVPVEGRCLNLLGPSSMFGMVGSRHIYRTLVATHLMQIDREALLRIAGVCCSERLERLCRSKKQTNPALMLLIFNLLAQALGDVPAESLWLLSQRAVLRSLSGPEVQVDKYSLLLEGQVILQEDFFQQALPLGRFFPDQVHVSCNTPAVLAVWDESDWVHFDSGDSEPSEMSFKDQQSTLDCLAQVPLFRGLSEKMMLSILPFVTERHFADKDVITCGGEDAHAIHLVDEGSVMLFERNSRVQHDFMSSLRGYDFFLKSFGKEIAEVKQGDCFGQIEFFLFSSMPYTSICKGSVRLFVIDQKCLRKIPSLSSLVSINVKGKQPPASSTYKHSEKEVSWIRHFFWLESNELCPSTLEASLFLARRASETIAEAGEELEFGRESSSTILVVRKGLLRSVRDREEEVSKRQRSWVPDMLEEGDVLDPKVLGEEAYLKEFKMVAVKRSALVWFPSKAREMARRIEAEDHISAIREHETFKNCFKHLSYFLFDKLARTCTRRSHECQDQVYNHSLPSDSVVFLLDGEFKVTKKNFHDAPLASVSPGTFFGHAVEPEEELTDGFVVFATGKSHVLEMPMRELSLSLPEDSITDIKARISSSALHYMQDDDADDADDAVDDPRHRHMQVHSDYTSAAMQIFVERIEKGKVTPCYEDETSWAYGPKPEDVLPSLLRLKTRARLLESRQRVSSVRRVRKATEEEENPHRVMGLSKLKNLQKKIDEIKEDPRLHRTLKMKIREHKLQVNGHPEFSEKIMLNRQLVKDPWLDVRRREEKMEKTERLKEAMTATKQENSEKDLKRIERTNIAINRKEINDEKRLHSVRAAIAHAKLTRLSAMWLLNVALVSRASTWKRLVDLVRRVRSDLMLWSAAAISIQRRYRKHLGKRLTVKYDIAATSIAKFYSKFKLERRLKRKKESIPVIHSFLLDVQRTMKTARFVFRQYRRKVVKIQRAFRQYRNFAALHDAKLFDLWDKHVDEALKKFAPKASHASSSTGGTSKTLYISPDIKLKKLRAFATSLRRQLLVDKDRWRDAFNLWLTREEYRFMIETQKSMLRNEHLTVRRDKIHQSVLDMQDKPPKCPLYLVPPPPSKKIIELIRSAFLESNQT